MFFEIYFIKTGIDCDKKCYLDKAQHKDFFTGQSCEILRDSRGIR